MSTATTALEPTMRITTNNVPRDLIDAWELSPTEREEFDYLNWDAIEAGEDSATFFRYRGQLYDLGEFTRWDGPEFSPLAKWDGYRADSFYSALVIRFVDDHERVVVGLALS
jgi:hypothetical protein